jgi:hypothetical protein
MSLDRGRFGGVDAGDAAAFLRLMKDHVNGTDQAVNQVDRIDVVWDSSDLLKVLGHWNQASEDRLYVSIHEPTHSRPGSLSLIVHQADELGVTRDVVDVVSNRGPNSRDFVVFSLGDVERNIEAARELRKGAVDCSLPEFELAAEVVAEQTQGHASTAGDLPSRGAIETFSGKTRERSLENSFASFGLIPLRRRCCSHEQYYYADGQFWQWNE